jgi:hypothetical protein
MSSFSLNLLYSLLYNTYTDTDTAKKKGTLRV